MAYATIKTLDGRLRPIYEWYECAAISSLAVTTYFAAQPLGFSPYAKTSIMLGSIGWIAKRYIDGCKIREYQEGLNNIEPYFTTTGKIPHTHKETWLGRGFEFTAVHAQRVWEAEKPRYKQFYALPKSAQKARAHEVEVRKLLDRKQIAPDCYKARKASYTGSRTHTPGGVLELYTPAFVMRGIKKIGEYQLGRRKMKDTFPINQYRQLVKLNKKLKWKNGIAPLPPVGGKSIYHSVGVEEETDQFIDLEERNGHCVVFGASRTGKSRLLEFLLAQDIQRNDGPCILADPKGDSALLARAWAEAKKAGREDNFYVFALGYPDISAKYNAIAVFSRLTAVASRISESMEGGGDSSVFKDFAWRFLLVVANAMNGIGEKPSFKSIKRYIEDLEPIYLKYTEKFLDEHIDDWRDKVEKIKNPPPRRGANGQDIEVRMQIPNHFKGRSKELVARDQVLNDFFMHNEDKINVTIEGLRSALKNEMSYYNKITASLIPLLTKLTSGRIAELISPDYTDILDERPEISWPQIIQSNAVVVVLADAMTDPVVANAVLGMMFSDMLSVAGDIYKFGIDKGLHNAKYGAMKPIWLHIDEFHSILKGGSEGEPFASILNRSAGAGVRVTAYSQTLKDIEDATGSASTAGVILGNFNTTIMLRVKSEETAEYLTQAVDKCDRYDLEVTGMTGANGNELVDEDDLRYGSGSAGWFNTKNNMSVKTEAYEPIITPQMILNLPKGQAFALINGARLVKLRFPLLEDDDDAIPPTLEYMVKDLERKYERVDEDEFSFA
ncbi:conjugative transfer system coupling protein TraD [Vibrio sp. Y2-5]|uniref:conjugative transfer system coupling protein TraD n=1 Tax=Vibrio sp. Y2-5 TaxID=2743977 RepID=UPI00166042D9|nr:conjugative transfer system coupling protein TraD [Vibrio sp. Y2-5]MBD0788159.1 conjugative transfer system coupling protein TraD [Vibrio sp. Y2-5]